MGHAPSQTPRNNAAALRAHAIKPGEKRNPTGINGTGRAQALQVLDGMLGTANNKKQLRAAFQKEFNKDPARFFLVFIAPLIPKEAKLTLDPGAGGMQWASLLTTFPIKDKDTSTTPEASGSVPSVAGADGVKPSSERPNFLIAPPSAQANTAG